MDGLEGFKGYAYYDEPGETSGILRSMESPNLQVRGGQSFCDREPPAGLDLILQVGGSRRSNRLLAGPGRNLPFLPAPGNGLDMRVGDKAGFFRKVVANFSRIDEPLIVQSPAPLRGRLELVQSESPGQQPRIGRQDCCRVSPTGKFWTPPVRT